MKQLNELSSLNILDAPPEERFDRHTRLASIMFDIPTAFITFIDHERGWFPSKIGTEVPEVKRTDSICQRTLGRGFLEKPRAHARLNAKFSYTRYP